MNEYHSYLGPELTEALASELRLVALDAAGSVVGFKRQDVLADVVGQTFLSYQKELATKWRVQSSAKRPDTKAKLVAWFRKTAWHHALRWVNRENRVQNLEVTDVEALRDPSLDYPSSGELDLGELDKEDVKNELPVLVHLFQDKVLGSLTESERTFFYRHFVEKLPAEVHANLLGVQPATVRRTWYKLVRRMHVLLLAELHGWSKGYELFYQALENGRHFGGLLCLLRVLLEKGGDALESLLDSF